MRSSHPASLAFHFRPFIERELSNFVSEIKYCISLKHSRTLQSTLRTSRCSILLSPPEPSPREVEFDPLINELAKSEIMSLVVMMIYFCYEVVNWYFEWRNVFDHSQSVRFILDLCWHCWRPF